MIDEEKLIEVLKESGMIADNDYGNAMLDIIRKIPGAGEKFAGKRLIDKDKLVEDLKALISNIPAESVTAETNVTLREVCNLIKDQPEVSEFARSYLLIENSGGFISLTVFPTRKAAREEMCKRLSEASGVPLEEVQAAYEADPTRAIYGQNGSCITKTVRIIREGATPAEQIWISNNMAWAGVNYCNRLKSWKLTAMSLRRRENDEEVNADAEDKQSGDIVEETAGSAAADADDPVIPNTTTDAAEDILPAADVPMDSESQTNQADPASSADVNNTETSEIHEASETTEAVENIEPVEDTEAPAFNKATDEIWDTVPDNSQIGAATGDVEEVTEFVGNDIAPQVSEDIPKEDAKPVQKDTPRVGFPSVYGDILRPSKA